MRKSIFLLLPLFIFSCQHKIDHDAEKKIIRAQIDLIEQAHFSKNANQFYQSNAETWYDVRGGKISKLKKKEQIPDTQAYLDDMDFHQMIWRDTPVIELSEDGTMAYYLASVAIKGMLKKKPIFWVVSWQSVLKKIDSQWQIISTANTEADGVTSAAVLMEEVRRSLGFSDDILSIYALADCRGPKQNFKTLVLSNKEAGRMEQLYDQSHFILKHDINTAWMYDVREKMAVDSLDLRTKNFIKGHELHWNSFRPEDRYSNPNLVAIEDFQNQPAFKIERKDDLNNPVNFYYAFTDFRPLGYDLKPDETREKVTVFFQNWEKQDNLSIFKKAIFQQGEETFEYTFSSIKINQVSEQNFSSKVGLIE